eukprot:gnl/TRDRNA2_/TRDRNA2_162410_c1_seq1.p1 gnl/TRDRNA2_/TRDRNA2_162410_c1~~gnl/TRDRNA2_/TRDRNA2_162410_c1_seq1.p1  ORF type:complete len:685 (-),score=129.81 gnl/TRDRNA2_/TRDRNA2_162410_c1_seq1:74-2128(-)
MSTSEEAKAFQQDDVKLSLAQREGLIGSSIAVMLVSCFGRAFLAESCRPTIVFVRPRRLEGGFVMVGLALTIVHLLLLVLLPYWGSRKASCEKGYPWDPHLVYAAYQCVLRFAELHFYQQLGGPGLGSLEVCFRTLLGLLEGVNYYSDATVVCIMWSCRHDGGTLSGFTYWQVSAVVLLIGIVAMQVLFPLCMSIFFPGRRTVLMLRMLQWEVLTTYYMPYKLPTLADGEDAKDNGYAALPAQEEKEKQDAIRAIERKRDGFQKQKAVFMGQFTVVRTLLQDIPQVCLQGYFIVSVSSGGGFMQPLSIFVSVMTCILAAVDTVQLRMKNSAAAFVEEEGQLPMCTAICRSIIQFMRGSVEYDNGDIYYGNCNSGGARIGNGLLYMTTGEIYEGRFWDDFPDGIGCFTLPSGYRFVGDFTDMSWEDIRLKAQRSESASLAMEESIEQRDEVWLKLSIQQAIVRELPQGDIDYANQILKEVQAERLGSVEKQTAFKGEQAKALKRLMAASQMRDVGRVRFELRYCEALGCSEADMKAAQQMLTKLQEGKKVAKIGYAIGPDVLGVVFELQDASRFGTCFKNRVRINDPRDTRQLSDAGVVWEKIEDNETVLKVKGFHSVRGQADVSACYSVDVHLSGGRIIQIQGNDEGLKGEPFTYTAPKDEEVCELYFSKGQCRGVRTNPAGDP